jgi:hypothetical protein
MAEQEDVRIETAEDREWERVRDAVAAAEVDLNETYEEFLARTQSAEDAGERYRSKFDEDRPVFKIVEE